MVDVIFVWIGKKYNRALQGLEAIIDTKHEYPLSARNTVLLKAGHLVSYLKIIYPYTTIILLKCRMKWVCLQWRSHLILPLDLSSPLRETATLMMNTHQISHWRPTGSILRLANYTLQRNTYFKSVILTGVLHTRMPHRDSHLTNGGSREVHSLVLSSSEGQCADLHTLWSQEL